MILTYTLNMIGNWINTVIPSPDLKIVKNQNL